MKKLSSLFLFIAIFVAVEGCEYCPAQTNTNVPVVLTTNVTVLRSGFGNAALALGMGTNVANSLNFIGTIVQDDAPYFTNSAVKLDFGGIKHASHYGGYAAFFVPQSTNNWQLSYGAGIGYIEHQLGVANVTAQLGKTIPVPYISQYIGPLYADVTAGPDYNWTTKSVGAIALAGVTWGHSFGTWMLGINYSYGTITGLSGNIQMGGFYVTHGF